MAPTVSFFAAPLQCLSAPAISLPSGTINPLEPPDPSHLHDRPSATQCIQALDGVLRHAGLRDRVTVEQGLAGEVVGGLSTKYGPAQLLFEVGMCGTCVLFGFTRSAGDSAGPCIIHLLPRLTRTIHCNCATYVLPA